MFRKAADTSFWILHTYAAAEIDLHHFSILVLKVQTDNSCPPPIFLEEITKLADFFWGIFDSVRAALSALTPLALHCYAPHTQFQKIEKIKIYALVPSAPKLYYPLIIRIHNSDKNKNVQEGPSYRG